MGPRKVRPLRTVRAKVRRKKNTERRNSTWGWPWSPTVEPLIVSRLLVSGRSLWQEYGEKDQVEGFSLHSSLEAVDDPQVLASFL